MAKIFSKIGWITMTMFALYLFATTWIYFSFRSDVNFLLAKQDVVNYLPWRIAFYIHITGSMFALAVGPFNFLNSLQQKYRKIHRILGKIYMAGILILGGPAGFFMALFANGGFFAKISFAVLSILWVSTTWLGLKHILQKNISEHKKWMIRSYALTFAAVTLRLWTPILSAGLDFNESETLTLVPWLSWIPNLLVAELIIEFQKRKTESFKKVLSNNKI